MAIEPEFESAFPVENSTLPELPLATFESAVLMNTPPLV